MTNKHTYLKNEKNKENSFSRVRGFTPKKEEKIPTEKTISRTQLKRLARDLYNYRVKREARNERRTIKLPHIDLIRIDFFDTFTEDLKRKFFSKYGLLPQVYTQFNQTVLFEVADDILFQNFKSQLENLIKIDMDVPYHRKEYNVLALIDQFTFFDNRNLNSIPGSIGIVLNIIHLTGSTAREQKNSLDEFLVRNNIEFEVNQESDIYYLKDINSTDLSKIDANYDIVRAITSSRPLTVRPGAYGTFRTEYGFKTEIPDDLPIVGIIDTGVNIIEPFEGLVLPTINTTPYPHGDQSGHGTLVAGLAIFGTELPQDYKDSYIAKCRVLPIKVLHYPTDSVNFVSLLKAIKQAHVEHGVRIFNMSLVLDSPKKYNDAFSDFAYELDVLAYNLDILIFISVGNFDSQALHELLTVDDHESHHYPSFFYDLLSTSPVHSCTNTNICVPSESLNNVSVGALAGNLKDVDNTDISPASIYPAHYTRKFHWDYTQKVNKKELQKNQKNKYLNKPDLIMYGGDLQNEEAGIEVLTGPGAFFTKTAGTSLASPLITSQAALIQREYPRLDMQSVKALLINSATYFDAKKLPEFANNKSLLQKLVGFGKPDEELALGSDDNTLTMIIEDEIKSGEIMAIPINLPTYLKASGNKLIFNISLVYKFSPDHGNHLGYLPLHMSFNLVKNISIKDIATLNADEYVASKDFNWSEDHFGLEKRLFSNTQKKEYRLQPHDLVRLDGSLAIAIRCLSKKNIDSELKKSLDKKAHPFSLVINVKEELRNQTSYNLYNEMFQVNNLEIIDRLDLEDDAFLDLDN